MMKAFLEQILNPILRWKKGNPTEATGDGRHLITLPGIGAVRQDRLNRVLLLARNILIAFLLIQCLRSGIAVAHGKLLLRAMTVEEAQAPADKMREPIETYHLIMEKGLLGVLPKEVPQQLLGILGKQALFGSTPDNAREFAVGAEVPGCGKIIAIHADGIEMEKDGKTSTISVFPEFKK
jgi:hypothetical protein